MRYGKIHSMDNMERIKYLENLIELQALKLREKDDRILVMQELINLLVLRKFASRSEKKTDPSGDVFNVDEPDIEEVGATEETVTVQEHTRKVPKRDKLPTNLPRVIIEHDLPEEQKICACGCALTFIESVPTEQLDIIPAIVQVLVHMRKKYACRSCNLTIKTAPMPLQPIPKSMASPGLLAHILVSKYCDHLPLYRQVQIFNRCDILLSRGTLSQWVIRCGDLFQPIINLLQEKHLEYDIGYADETTVQVLKEPNKTAESKSYMWIFGGGKPECFAWILHYEPTRSGDVSMAFWEGFKGHIHTDAYSGYCSMEDKMPLIFLIKCWAHARRKFAEIAKLASKRGISHEVIARIAQLYKIEKKMKEDGCSFEKIKEIRQEKSKPILENIKKYLEEKRSGVPPQSGLGKAISYTLNHWSGLIRYLEDGRFEIDNNRTERIAKPFAVGRKNWLFSDSVNGANASANIYSLIETCKFHGIEPYEYLRHALTEIPKCTSVGDYEKLLPYNCKRMFKPPISQAG